MISQVQGRAPETVGLFRDKDTLLRELRSQINRKDLQLLEYARQVERLKRTRNQLVTGEYIKKPLKINILIF
jgi:hypothetical protein